MAYKHGVYTSEVATSMVAPITGAAGLQVIVGTAPVNMLKDPAAAVNVPLLVSSYKEAVEAVGYLPDFANYTLCECISANSVSYTHLDVYKRQHRVRRVYQRHHPPDRRGAGDTAGGDDEAVHHQLFGSSRRTQRVLAHL